MKKKVIILTIVALVIAIIGLLIINKPKDEKNYQAPTFLIVKTYSNYAWNTQFNGIAIFDDGTIYSWDYEEKTDGNYNDYIGDNDIETKSGMKDFILDKGTKRIKKVSDNDLNRLKEYINNLNDEDVNYEEKCLGADMGTTSISVYKNDKKYTLSTSGDCEGKSKTETAKKILDIIKKYS